jgi:hypothetical protein
MAGMISGGVVFRDDLNGDLGRMICTADQSPSPLPEMRYRCRNGMWEVLCDNRGGTSLATDWHLIFFGPGMTIDHWLAVQAQDGRYKMVPD